MFDSPHVDSGSIKRVHDQLLSCPLRGVNRSELLFPADEAVNAADGIPLLLLRGNHDDAAGLALLPGSTFDCVSYEKKCVVPYIVKIRNNILIIYGLNYSKTVLRELNEKKLSICSPMFYFEKHPQYLNGEFNILRSDEANSARSPVKNC